MIAGYAAAERRVAALDRELHALWQRSQPTPEPTVEVVDDPEQVDARSSLSAFAARMHRNYQTAAHIRRLAAELEWAATTPDARLIVTFPPRHSKSLHVSEHLPAWFLGNHPDARVIGASHTQRLANRFSRRVRNKIAHPFFPFPGVRISDDSGAVEAWDLAGTYGGYFAVGVGGSPAGTGADLIVIDDPIKNAAKAESESFRDALWEWYREDIRTRLEPGGSIVCTATRWHDEDLTGRLLAEQETGGEQWRHLHLPAIDGDGNALWPERWPAATLLALKGAVGTRIWEAQYQGDPVPAEGGTFKRHWWRRYRVLPERFARIELMLDSAFKEGAASDYSAIAVWGDDGAGSAYLLRVWRDRVAFPELIRLAHDAHAWAREAFPGVRIPLVIEDKASGQSAIQVLSRPYHTGDGVLPALPVVPYAIPAGASKVARAEGVTPLVEGGRAFVPESAPWLDDWLTEHERFPFGAHDDQVDTTSMALTRFGLVPRGGKARSF